MNHVILTAFGKGMGGANHENVEFLGCRHLHEGKTIQGNPMA